MPKYRIALLPGNSTGLTLLEKAVEILSCMELNAEYIWIEKDIKDIKDFKKNLERMKSTSCALSAPFSCFEDLASFSPVTEVKKIFHLTSHFYFFRTFLSSPLSFTGIIHSNVPEKISLSPMPENLRNILEDIYPQMAYFASQTREELFASLMIRTKEHCSYILDEAFQLALQYGFRKLLIVKEENCLAQESLEIAKKYSSIEIESISPDKACHRAVQVSETPEMLLASTAFAQTMSYFYDSLKMGFSASMEKGKNYALFLPMEGKTTVLGILLAVQMLLKYLRESQKETEFYSALEKLLQEDPAHLSFLDSEIAEKEILISLMSLLKNKHRP